MVAVCEADYVKLRSLWSSFSHLSALGAGESGKSTIAKQMKIIYLKGFQDAERRPYKEIIFSNIIMSMRALVLAVERLQLDIAPENKDRARLFKSNTILFEQNVTDEIADAVKVYTFVFVGMDYSL